jgi:hypothetical protein
MDSVASLCCYEGDAVRFLADGAITFSFGVIGLYLQIKENSDLDSFDDNTPYCSGRS